MEQRVSLVTLGVTDLVRARAFYEALGWMRALKLGAFDFVSKPLDLAGLRKLVASAIKLSGTQDADTSVFGPRLLGRPRRCNTCAK